MPLVMTIESDDDAENEESDFEMEQNSKGASFTFSRNSEAPLRNNDTARRRLALNLKIEKRLNIKRKAAERRKLMERNAQKFEGIGDNNTEVKEKDSVSGESGSEQETEKSSDAHDEKKEKMRSKNTGAKKKKKKKKITSTDFSDLKLSRPLLRAIQELDYKNPTPVQAKAIPLALAGKDLLVNAMTGSGKTAAFMLPTLERLLYRPPISQTRVLVLTPTRELAAQIFEMTNKMAKYANVTSTLVVGGLSQQEQAMNLRARPDIVIATPGRLIDHLHNTLSFAIEHVEILILDEADRLLESGFRDELHEIIRLCPRGRQSMLFSATLDKRVNDLVQLSLNNPRLVSIDPYSSVVDTLAQEFIRLRASIGKAGKVAEAALERRREAIALSLCKRNFNQRVIIFVKSKAVCHRVLLIFGLAKCRAAELHGNLTQAQRLEALDLFKAGEVDVLVCTDLAARGLDIAGVATVINMHLPRELRMYIHRVGRTARAGRSGVSVSLAGPNDRKLLRAAVKKSKDVVRSRKVPDKVIRKYARIIEEMEEDIAEILLEEKQEKEFRKAEMEAQRASNMIVHEQEIMSKPAKQWFQTPAQKLAAKKASVRMFGEDEPPQEEEEQKSKRGRKKKEKKLSRQAQLRGLSRKKRRRKMAEWAEEDYQKELEANPELRDELQEQRPGDGASKVAKRQLLRKERDRSQGKGKGPKVKKKKKRNYQSEDATGGSSRFDVSEKKMKAEPPRKKRRKGTNKSFKSKSRYKRR